MNIAVCGTPEVAADIFEQIRQCGVAEITAVLTTPDTHAHRGKKISPPPVKNWADQNKLKVIQPEKLDEALGIKFKQNNITLVLVISYGKILPLQFLQAAPPVWNLHFSLLPKYRGASPVPSAILAGETRSGITIFRITEGLDEGPIIAQESLDIKNLRADKVFENMVHEGAELLITELARFKNGVCQTTEQHHQEASYCRKISKQDGEIVPSKITAEAAYRKILAFFPWPSAWLFIGGRRIKLLNAVHSEKKVAAGVFQSEAGHLYLGFSDAALEITEVQAEGRRPMSGEEFGRGIR